MIDLKFELNDITGKYDARSHHTEIYISDDTKMDEETVRLYKYILDELIQHAIGGISHLIFYNSKNNNNMQIAEVRNHIEQLFHKEKSRIYYSKLDPLTEFPYFWLTFEDLSEEEMTLLNTSSNSIDIDINYCFEGPIDNKNINIVVATFWVKYKVMLEGKEYDKYVKIGESHFDTKSMITLPINGEQA